MAIGGLLVEQPWSGVEIEIFELKNHFFEKKVIYMSRIVSTGRKFKSNLENISINDTAGINFRK